MKRYLPMCWLLPILIVVGCGPKSVFTKKLQQIDSLSEHNPQEAMVQLKVIREEAQSESERTRMTWSLLWTKAQFKSDIPQESDSAMRRVVDYFDRKGTPWEQAEAHYYLAAVYFDMHDSPRCITHALKALDLLEGLHEDSLRAPSIFRTCSMLSYVYRLQMRYGESLIYAQKEYDIAQRYGMLDPYVIMDVATSHYQLGRTDSTNVYYKKALAYISKEGDVAGNATHLCEMLDFYSEMGAIAEAETCYIILSSLPDSARPINYYSCKGAYYERIGQIDSAIVSYNHEMQFTNNFYAILNAALSLMNIYTDKGEYEKAAEYAKIYAVANDSVWAELKMEQANNARNEYQYQRDMAAEAEAYRKAQEAEERTHVIIGAGLLLLLLAMLLYSWNRRRMTERLLMKEREIEQVRGANENLIQVALRSRAGADKSPIMERFRRAADGYEQIRTDDEWEELYAALDDLHPGFYQHVVSQLPEMLPKYQRIACLLKMGMTAQEIVNVTGFSKATVYRRIEEIRTKIIMDS